ncbi:MAG: PIN domain-containing protein [Verrucomicrobiaceae bacterium]
MNYLLDVNVLVAWGWIDHTDHDRVDRWVASVRADAADMLLTSAIPQMSFVRVSVQRSIGEIMPQAAGDHLHRMLAALGVKHRFLPDDQAGFHWPEWCQSASRTTDAHLLTLAKAHRAKLATLDTGIPGAFLIP